MRLRLLLTAVGLLTAGWAALGVPARATYGARVTADEPQYLLSAISLAEDLDLDISDELEAQRWRDFHAVDLPEQTKPAADDRRISPHDPLFPVLLAVPVALGGWVGAKIFLAAMAGVLAALTAWVAVRRLGVPPLVAAPVVLAFSMAAPMATYATQVYPELPAALAVMVAVAALTGPLRRGGVVTAGLAVTALPWLSVKYVLVAAALAAIALARLVLPPAADRAHDGDGDGDRARSRGWALAAGLIASGAVFLIGHRLLYGGFTAYATGDHFVGGEFTAVGSRPSYVGRSSRLVGLLVDRSFGLAAWAPIFLVALPALAALARRRPPGAAAVALPLLAGWFTATFLAFTMHGWWSPGRQVVVVVPLVVVVTAWWAAAAMGPATAANGRIRITMAAMAVVGLVSWLWLSIEVLTQRLRLVIDFDQTTNPIYRAWREVLPDYRTPTTGTWVAHGLWIVVLMAFAWVGWRSVSPPSPT